MFYVQPAPTGGVLGSKVSFGKKKKSHLGSKWPIIAIYIICSKLIFSKSSNGLILSFWNLDLHIIIYTKQKTSVKHFLGLTSRSWYMRFKQRELKKKNEKLFLFLFWSCVTFGFTARHTRGCFSTWKNWHRMFFSRHHSRMKEWCKTHDIHK